MDLDYIALLYIANRQGLGDAVALAVQFYTVFPVGSFISFGKIKGGTYKILREFRGR